MSLSLVLALVWIVAVNLRGMFPSKDHHWRFAYGMIAIGLPILAGVFYQNGPWWGLGVLACAMWIMRWPVIYLGRWIKRQFGERP